MAEKEWYTVRGIFRWYFKESGETANFEDRILTFRADSFDDALDMAEKEAREYCEEDPKANYKIESLGIWNAYSTQEKTIENGIEVFSQRFDSDLTSEEYIKKYYPKSGELN